MALRVFVHIVHIPEVDNCPLRRCDRMGEG